MHPAAGMAAGCICTPLAAGPVLGASLYSVKTAQILVSGQLDMGPQIDPLAAGPVLGDSLYSVKIAQILVLGPWPGAQNGVPNMTHFGVHFGTPF